MMLYFRSLKIVQHDIFVEYTCLMVFLVSCTLPFSIWVVPVFLLEYCIITLRICCLLFKIVFWRLVCDIQASWPQIPLSKLHFIQFRPLFSRLGHTHSFTWGPYAVFHGMTLLCHIEGSMITAVWTHLWMFLNSKFPIFVLKFWLLLKPVTFH
jgi:hypothetical protein